MATTKKNVIKYINDNEAQVTKAFEKKACIFGTDEFKQWREYKEMFPKAKMVTLRLDAIHRIDEKYLPLLDKVIAELLALSDT